MSLNVSWDGPINLSNIKYANLSDADKRFLIPEDLVGTMSLPTTMVITHVGFITEESIKHIISRLDMANGVKILERLNDKYAKAGETDFATYLKKFIGVTSNWPTYTKKQFLEVHGQDILELNSTGIKKMAKGKHVHLA